MRGRGRSLQACGSLPSAARVIPSVPVTRSALPAAQSSASTRAGALGVLLAVGIALLVFGPPRLPLIERPQSPARRADPRPQAWPASMAAIGDSITQAVNLGYGDGDAGAFHSWATGRDSSDPVVSHYERILAIDPSIADAAYNNSISGARMVDAPRQAQVAVAQGVDYVTFLMGANDACASTRFGMTSVRSFRRDFERAIRTLVGGLPDAVVYVVSIPDVYRLWEVMRDDDRARESWRAFGTCGVLLSERSDDSARLRVRARVQDFNAVLEEVCAAHEGCFYDGGAVFDYRFTAEDVSPVDFFHPSVTGQKHLAEVSWAHSPLAQG